MGGVVVVAVLLGVHFAPRSADEAPPQSAPPNATFVGSRTCAGCHPSQSAEWKASQHHAAMAKASEQTVLGRFDGRRFTYGGTTSEFVRRDSNFVVRTDGPDGKQIGRASCRERV